MKKYIFVTHDIHLIGGTQMYTAGKAKYLEEHGWQVRIFFEGKQFGESEIPSLTKYVSGCGFEELSKRTYKISDRDRKKFLDKLVDILRIDPTLENEIIIESHSDVYAYWAELLAEKIHARHHFFSVDESFRNLQKFYSENLDFFYFKYLRRELFSIPIALERLFNGYRNLTFDEPIFPTEIELVREMDSVQDVENSIADQIDRQDFNIAYIGRTGKLYVPAVFKGVAEFARNHPDKKIQFIIVGRILSLELIELMGQLFENLPNVSLVPTDNLVPIPRALFKKLDVAIAGAQTAIFCAYENVPVITTNMTGDKSGGCLFYDTNDAWYDEPRFSFAEMLERVLINREYDNRQINLPDRKPADWHYEKSLELQLTQPEPTFEYFTEKFKLDCRRNWYLVFPFEMVPRKSRIVIYGENEISHDYRIQVMKYCTVVAIVADNYEHFDRSVLPPEALAELDYDIVIIADIPDTQRIDSISEKIFRITGKKNYVYTWNFFMHE